MSLFVLHLPFRAPLALSHATVMRQPKHARSRGEAGRRVGANRFTVSVPEQVSGIEVKALLPRHGRTWFMAGCMSSGFACCRAGFMAGFMSSKKPRFDRAKMQAGFPCNLPRALAFLAQVEDVLFEDGWMGFHREQRGQGPRSPVPALRSTWPVPKHRGQVLAGGVSCSPFDEQRGS